jgi:Golgi nucleoside diphosphatase
LPHHVSKKVRPGLSSFAENPADAGVSLKGLVEFLQEQVPESDWKVTPIWLKATAGLRMLEISKSTAVLNSVQAFLRNPANSPFVFKDSWARIISGNEEGGFGWIAYNYLRRIIGPKQNAELNVKPYSVIEMGGASAQVSQLATNKNEVELIPSDYKFSFSIEENQYDLYTHSYLGFNYFYFLDIVIF